MPRQRIHHSRRAHDFPDDFPQRLVRFQKESGLSWSETARCLGISPMTIRRCWWKAGIGPNYRHLNALLSLADDLVRGHLFRE